MTYNSSATIISDYETADVNTLSGTVISNMKTDIKVEIKTEQEELAAKSAGFLCPSCSAHFLLEQNFIEHISKEHHGKNGRSAESSGRLEKDDFTLQTSPDSSRKKKQRIEDTNCPDRELDEIHIKTEPVALNEATCNENQQ